MIQNSIKYPFMLVIDFSHFHRENTPRYIFAALSTEAFIDFSVLHITAQFGCRGTGSTRCALSAVSLTLGA